MNPSISVRPSPPRYRLWYIVSTWLKELIDDNKALPPTDMDPAFFTFEKDGISDNFGLLLIETSTHFSRLANAFIFLIPFNI